MSRSDSQYASGSYSDSDAPVELEPATEAQLYEALIASLDEFDDLLGTKRDRDGSLTSFFSQANRARDALIRVQLYVSSTLADAPPLAHQRLDTVLAAGKQLLLSSKNVLDKPSKLSDWVALADAIQTVYLAYDAMLVNYDYRDRVTFVGRKVYTATVERRDALLAARALVNDLEAGVRLESEAPRPHRESEVDRVTDAAAARAQTRAARAAERAALVERGDVAAVEAWAAARRAQLADARAARRAAAAPAMAEILDALSDKAARRSAGRLAEVEAAVAAEVG